MNSVTMREQSAATSVLRPTTTVSATVMVLCAASGLQASERRLRWILCVYCTVTFCERLFASKRKRCFRSWLFYSEECFAKEASGATF